MMSRDFSWFANKTLKMQAGYVKGASNQYMVKLQKGYILDIQFLYYCL